ncbi:enoyl-CoA hydratase/isomerase family protein [Brevibacterium album]|uniref:enoyl-CoA hydratase/isomerase family protein n=1 Tax=Brevibacterium album TaxID=417948 RepID=UPI0003FF2317|nr:enoyl-CoA hydratase/isomerase family protein [Brevibacterium album]
MIRQSRSEGIVTLVLDNPGQANALTAPMLTELCAAFEAASADPEVRGVLLTSAGEKGFSAGMDTAQFDHASPVRAGETIARLGRVCEAVKACAVPVAVALRGYCIGGALEIAAAADFRVGGERSWYSMPEVRIGIPSVLEAANLHRLMGWTKAAELILTARRFSAQEMERCGFLTALVPDAEAESRALALLLETALADREVLAQQKRLFRTWQNTFEREAVADSRKEFALAFARREG